MTLIGRVLLAAAERDPGALAIVDGATRLTWAEWNARANRAAHALAALGVQPGARVAVLMRNREETATVWAGCQKLGAVYSPMNFRLAPAEVEASIALVRPRVLVFEERTRALGMDVMPRLGDVSGVYVGDGAAPPGSRPFEALLAAAPAREPAASAQDAGAPAREPAAQDRAPRAGDIADARAAAVVASGAEPVGTDDDAVFSLIFFTSGTTGRPKGVPRTQRAEYSATLFNLVHHRWRHGTRTLGVMPLYHTMGVRGLLSMVCVNGAFVILRDWSAAAALELIERERVSSLFLVPTMFHMLLAEPDFDRRDLTSIEHVAYAGMTMHDALNQEIVERLRPRSFVNFYGSSEIYSFASCDDAGRKPSCVGKPTVHSRLRIVVADRGRRVTPDETVPPGELGEIIADMQAPDAFTGYWDNPEATERQVRDGWYYTGDLGYQNAGGDYYVVGRVDDMVISGGENIHPLEVENVLARCPGVLEVVVAGLPDERWGEIVTAFIVPASPALRVDDVERYCRDSAELAGFKRPRRVVLVEAIPKSPVGKVLRRQLRAGEYRAIG